MFFLIINLKPETICASHVTTQPLAQKILYSFNLSKIRTLHPKKKFDHFDDRFESTPQKRYDDSSDDSNWDQVLTKNHNG